VRFEPDFLIWHQGEGDTGSNADAQAYAMRFRNMLAAIRALGVSAPIFVPLASICDAAADIETRRGQAKLADPARAVYPGPDTDSLALALRYDRCHFSTRGIELHARMWALTLRRYRDAGPGETFARVTAASIDAGPAAPE
jgi:Carbohydrate esterase, sialic acid-specific acetylesterase